MRLSAKWQDAWSTITPIADSRRVERIAIDGDIFDVVRMGRGEPIVMVPGLAGGWKLLAPLARRLSREFEVVVYSLRGDRSMGRSGLSEARRRHADVGGHAADLAALIGRLGMERTTLTRNLRPLVRQGLITLGNGDDRRVRTLTLTAKGRRAAVTALPHWRKAQRVAASDINQAALASLQMLARVLPAGRSDRGSGSVTTRKERRS